MSAMLEQTVSGLFRSFETRGIRYAVLRNYELLPALAADASSPHTDIDLVIDSRDLPLARAAMAEIAEEEGWDALTECDHWAQSSSRHHNIEVFRFIRTRPLQFLQVDVFHGYVLRGLPLYDEAQMLDGRIHDEARGITRIDPLKENAYRLVQILGLYPEAQQKRERYRKRLLEFRAAHRASFDDHLRAIFGAVGVRAADALECGDIPGFLRRMRWARVWFALKFTLRHAFVMPRYIATRVRDQVLRFYARQCGYVLRVRAADARQQQALRRAMDSLVQNSFIDEWFECEAGARRSLHDYRAMEQGAIIVQWTGSQNADIDLARYADIDDITEAVLNKCRSRHKSLFVRKAAKRQSAVAEVHVG